MSALSWGQQPLRLSREAPLTDRAGCARPHRPVRAAIALYRAMDMTLWLPQAESALGQVEGQ